MLFHDQQRQLYNYCEEHSTHHSALLAELYRETNIRTLKPRMASGPLQGRFLAAIAMMKKKSPWSSQIKPVVGDALDLLAALDDGIDMVFIDAKKRDYIKYYDLIIDKVKSGGLILADNILWDGKVLDASPDRTTQSIKEFNSYVAKDLRVHNVIFPLRDGVNIMVKR